MKNFLKNWKIQIFIFILSIIISFTIIWAGIDYINKIPREIIPFISSIFATLLGLTFTAFAIFTAFLPNVREDFLRTSFFKIEGKTFGLTIYIELFTTVITFFDYILYGTELSYPLFSITIILITLSFGYFSLLIYDIIKIFELTRKKLAKEN
jgi:hypothetical protein